MPIEATEPLPTVDPSAPAKDGPPTIESARAARYAATAAAAPGAAGADPAAAGNTKPPADAGAPKPDAGSTATIAMDEAALKAATALSREAREAKAARAAAESKVAEAEPLIKAKALIAAGKHREAMTALGIDLNAAVAEELAEPGASVEPTAEAKVLAEMAAELKAIKDAEAARVERDKQTDAERAKAAQDADVKAVTAFVGTEAKKYVYLSRNPAWVEDAYQGAIEAHETLTKSGKTLTDADRRNLVLAALDEAEEGHAKNAKLYGVAPAATTPATNSQVPSPPTPSARPTTFTADLRGGTSTPVTKQRTRMTFEQAKRARREASNG